MGDHDDGLALFPGAELQVLQQRSARRTVEGAGRFIGEDDLGPGDERPGDSDPLLLSSRELAGPVREPSAEPQRADHLLEQRLVHLPAGQLER